MNRRSRKNISKQLASADLFVPIDSSHLVNVKDLNRLKLAHIFYAITLLACGMSLFSPLIGFVIGSCVICFWFMIVTRRISLVEFFVIMVATAIVLAFVVAEAKPSQSGDAQQLRVCFGNIQKIGEAIELYHDAYDCYPPAFVEDESGRRLHSWRVLILEFMEKDEQDLYRQYDFEQAWDSPRNRRLWALVPDCYQCPAADRRGGHTDYLAIVGDEAAWQGARPRVRTDFKRKDAISIVEVWHSNIIWAEPEDTVISEIVDRLDFHRQGNRPYGHGTDNFFTKRFFSINVALTNGAVRQLSEGSDPDELEQILWLESDWKLEHMHHYKVEPYVQIKYGKYALTALYAALIFLPLPWRMMQIRKMRRHWRKQSTKRLSVERDASDLRESSAPD